MHRALLGHLIRLSLLFVPLALNSARVFAAVPAFEVLCEAQKPSEWESVYSRLLPSLKKECPDCDRGVLQKFVSQFNDSWEGGNLTGDLLNLSAMNAVPGRILDIGSEDQWSRIEEMSDAAHKRAFGVAFGEKTCETPIARFQKGLGSQLTFVASDHEFAMQPEAIQAQRAKISEEFRTSKPKSIILEGYPQRIPCKIAAQRLFAPTSQLTSEQDFTMQLALRQGVRVQGGEPDGPALSEEDEHGMNILFGMAGAVTSSEGRIQGSLQDRLDSIQRAMRIAPWSLQQFMDWYSRKNRRSFEIAHAYHDITPSYFAKKSGRPVLETNRLMTLKGIRRNQNASRLIRRELMDSGNVMVVYGNGHLPELLPVFERAFGRAPDGLACRARVKQAADITVPCEDGAGR